MSVQNKGRVSLDTHKAISAALAIMLARRSQNPYINIRRPTMAHAIQIDTLAFAKRLQAAGADERLAEAIVEGITDADTSSLATKEDIALVKEDIRQVETAIKTDIANSHADILKWLFGIIFAQTAIVIAVFSFLLN